MEEEKDHTAFISISRRHFKFHFVMVDVRTLSVSVSIMNDIIENKNKSGEQR